MDETIESSEDPVQITIDTYNAVANSYKETHGSLQLTTPLLDHFLTLIKGKKILDAGCGSGRDARYFTEKGYEVIGIDLATNLLNIAQSEAPKASFQKMDIRKIEFADDFFDGIWAMASVLHLPKNQLDTALAEFFRVLKPEGILYLSVKQGVGERYISKDYYINHRKYFSFYQKDEISSHLSTIGFTVNESSSVLLSHGTFIDIIAKK